MAKREEVCFLIAMDILINSIWSVYRLKVGWVRTNDQLRSNFKINVQERVAIELLAVGGNAAENGFATEVNKKKRKDYKVEISICPL